jgi:hypothetical protein
MGACSTSELLVLIYVQLLHDMLRNLNLWHARARRQMILPFLSTARPCRDVRLAGEHLLIKLRHTFSLCQYKCTRLAHFDNSLSHSPVSNHSWCSLHLTWWCRKASPYSFPEIQPSSATKEHNFSVPMLRGATRSPSFFPLEITPFSAANLCLRDSH